MKYSDLIDAVAAKTGAAKADAKKSVEAVFEALADTVSSKDGIIVPGFGTFSTKSRPAKTGRNPQTGATLQIAAKTVVGFKPAKLLAERVNG